VIAAIIGLTLALILAFPLKKEPPWHACVCLTTIRPIESQVFSRLTVRACLKIAKGAAAGNFGFGQGGEGGASPQRAVTTEPTLDKDKRPAARRVFAEKAVWLRYSSV